jgi:cytoskeletal protein RodZ
MINELKSANSVKIGKIFADTRIQKSFTIEDISQSLVMNIEYIKSIESGCYSVFPSEAFARAYFLKYKNFLSLNCEFPSLYTETEKRKIVQSNKNLQFNFFSTLFYRNLVAVLISMGLIMAGFKIVNTNTNSKIKIEDNPIKKITEEKILVVQNNINKEGDQSIFFPIKNIYSDNKETPVINIKNSLNLNFLENCWVEISSNKKLIVYQLFMSGESYSINIEKPFKIIVGNATGIQGTYNGNKIDFISNANRLSVNTISFNDE